MLKKFISNIKMSSSLILGGFLFFLFLVSKEILVLNEEFLILIAFIGTTLFLYNTFKESLPETLDLRANQIEDSLKQIMINEYSNLVNSEIHLEEAEKSVITFNNLLKDLPNFSQQLIRLNIFSIKLETYLNIISSLQEFSKELRQTLRVKNIFLKSYILNKLVANISINNATTTKIILSKCLHNKKRTLILKNF